jgi:hypothetical protein
MKPVLLVPGHHGRPEHEVRLLERAVRVDGRDHVPAPGVHLHDRGGNEGVVDRVHGAAVGEGRERGAGLEQERQGEGVRACAEARRATGPRGAGRGGAHCPGAGSGWGFRRTGHG